MKFDVSNWIGVPMGVSILHDTGRLRVETTRPAALIVTQADVFGEVRRASAGFGTSFDVVIEGAFEFRLDGPKDCEGFMMEAPSVYCEKSSVVFTNMDGVPADDGHFGAVKKLMRQLRLENSVAMAKMRAEMNLPAQPEDANADPAGQAEGVSVEVAVPPEGQGGADAPSA